MTKAFIIKNILRPLSISAVLAVSSCGGIGKSLEDPSEYYGCYTFKGNPIISISAKNIHDLVHDNSNAVIGFMKIRDSDFVITKKQMIFDKTYKLEFNDKDSDSQYEFEKGSRPPTLLLYNKIGNAIKLTKAKQSCHSSL